MLKSKIHGATVTDANVDYQGSIAIDKTLMEAANILPYEKVQVVNVTTGARLETYAIAGAHDSGTICLNGGAAHHAKKGDTVIILSFAAIAEEQAADFIPRIVYADERNMVSHIESHIEASDLC
jgi:aspartate 1-decarboxylase